MKLITSSHQCKFCGEKWLTTSDNKDEFEFYDMIAKVEAVNHVAENHKEAVYAKC